MNRVKGKYCEYQYTLKDNYIYFYPLILGRAYPEYWYDKEIKNDIEVEIELKNMLNTEFIGRTWDYHVYTEALMIIKREETQEKNEGIKVVLKKSSLEEELREYYQKLSTH